MVSRVADIDRRIPLSNSRAYKHPQKKWQVASAALEVLQNLLQTLEVIPHDFVERDIQIPGDEREGAIVRLPWELRTLSCCRS